MHVGWACGVCSPVLLLDDKVRWTIDIGSLLIDLPCLKLVGIFTDVLEHLLALIVLFGPSCDIVVGGFLLKTFQNESILLGYLSVLAIASLPIQTLPVLLLTHHNGHA